MSSAQITVLIVDDSAVMRNLIGKIVGSADDLVVAGKALNGAFGLQKIQSLNPDVVVLDLEMPDMNGIEFLKQRRERGIDVPVIILSSRAEKGARITMEALSLGASDFIMKPTGVTPDEIYTIADTLVQALRGYGRIYQQKKKAQPTAPAAAKETAPTAPERPPVPGVGAQPIRSPGTVAGTDWGELFPYTPLLARIGQAPIDIVAIGISTGGPNALREVFSRLDPELGVPIVVVQHMPPGFTAEFARSLDKICPLEVKEAEEGDLLVEGRVLIAPGANHLRVEKRRLSGVALLGEDPIVNGHRPSVDVLFESVGRHYGASALSVIMTGMGRDGAKQIGSIHRAGGITVAQDEESCVVFGMPRAAIEAGEIQYVVPLLDVAGTINSLVKASRQKP